MGQRKDVQLFAIGNALLDIQVHIHEADLVRFGVPKGTMALVHHQEQQQLLERLRNRIVHQSSGGSAANTVITFARLGGRAAYGTILGNDDLGDAIAREFSELGVDLFAPRHPSTPTGSCLVLITPDAERTMKTALAANIHFAPEHIDEHALQRSEWLYVEGYKFSEPLSAEAIERAIFYARRHHTQIALTFSDVFIVEQFRSELQKTLQSTQLLFCNEQEAMAFTEYDTPQQAFKELSQQVPLLVMTRGANGSWIADQGRHYSIPAYPATAIDTTGAGDTYAAAFFFAVVQQKPLEIAGHFASYAGAQIVSQLGARLEEEKIAQLKQLFPMFEDLIRTPAALSTVNVDVSKNVDR